MAAHGYATFAISYDSVETLASFAEKHGITYPLLSDTGSRAIRDLGLYNRHVYEQHGDYGIQPRDEHQGVAYPGTFVLDEDGVIVAKRFEQSYRVRPTGNALLERVLGIRVPAHGSEVSSAADGVQVRAHLDSPTFGWFQQLVLTVELTIDAGLHVYGRPIPADYVPVSIQVDPVEGLDVGEVEWPEPRRFVMEGLDDEFWVYEGTIAGRVPLTFTAAQGSGDQVVRGTVSFQACAEYYCLPPSEVRFELAVQEVGLVDRPLKR